MSVLCELDRHVAVLFWLLLLKVFVELTTTVTVPYG